MKYLILILFVSCVMIGCAETVKSAGKESQSILESVGGAITHVHKKAGDSLENENSESDNKEKDEK